MNCNWNKWTGDEWTCDIDLARNVGAKLSVYKIGSGCTTGYEYSVVLTFFSTRVNIPASSEPCNTVQEAQNAAVAELKEFLRQMANLYHKMGCDPE